MPPVADCWGWNVASSFEDTLLRSNQVAPCPLPLRDDGKNTWINPVERLGYQVESVKAALGDFADLKDIQSELSALAGKPSDAAIESA